MIGLYSKINKNILFSNIEDKTNHGGETIDLRLNLPLIDM